jgi:hypothetical protein
MSTIMGTATTIIMGMRLTITTMMVMKTMITNHLEDIIINHADK